MDDPLLSAAWRYGLRRLSPAGAAGRLSVLIFHRVLPVPDPLQPGEPSAADFERLMRWVGKAFNVLPLSQAVRGLRDEFLPERALAITFDDGYADNHDVALPVLARLGLPATFFVAAGYLDGGLMFNDAVIESVRQAKPPRLDLNDMSLGSLPVGNLDERRAAIDRLLEHVKYLVPTDRQRCVEQIAERSGARLPTDLMMTSAKVAALSRAGMEIGAHTLTHPILARIDIDAARREIDTGRRRLQEIVGPPVALFAYPNGKPGVDYAREHVALVRELGFDAAVSTAWGSVGPGADLYQIPRFTPWDRGAWRFGARLARNLIGGDHARV